MEGYFEYKHTKQELVEFIKKNDGLANVELDNTDNYVDINVEIYPSDKVITYCRVDVSKDKKAHVHANKLAAVLNDYLYDYVQI